VQTTKYLIEQGTWASCTTPRRATNRRRGRPFVDGYGTPPFVQKANSGGGALMDMAVYHLV